MRDFTVGVPQLESGYTVEKNEKREAWNVYDEDDNKVNELATEQEAKDWVTEQEK